MLRQTRIFTERRSGCDAPRAGSQRGLTMIEVLVALLVLAIGLAGMAAMHLNSLKNVSSSYMRSLASTIALDFEERLWIEASVADDDDLDADGCPVPATVAEQLQAAWSGNDARWDWTAAERATLPNLSITAGNATKSTSASNTVWIEIPVTVSWSEARFEEQEEENEEFTYTVRSLCRQTVVS